MNLLKAKICIQGKQIVQPFPKESKFQSDDLLNLIYSDLYRLMSVLSHLVPSQYFVTFIGDKSHYIEISFLNTNMRLRMHLLNAKQQSKIIRERK